MSIENIVTIDRNENVVMYGENSFVFDDPEQMDMWVQTTTEEDLQRIVGESDE